MDTVASHLLLLNFIKLSWAIRRKERCICEHIQKKTADFLLYHYGHYIMPSTNKKCTSPREWNRVLVILAQLHWQVQCFAKYSVKLQTQNLPFSPELRLLHLSKGSWLSRLLLSQHSTWKTWLQSFILQTVHYHGTDHSLRTLIKTDLHEVYSYFLEVRDKHWSIYLWLTFITPSLNYYDPLSGAFIYNVACFPIQAWKTLCIRIHDLYFWLGAISPAR